MPVEKWVPEEPEDQLENLERMDHKALVDLLVSKALKVQWESKELLEMTAKTEDLDVLVHQVCQENLVQLVPWVLWV